MNIIVTGSAGFIGHHVMMKLSSEGNVVLGIDNINDYYDTKLKVDRLYQQGFYNPLMDNKIFESALYGNLYFIKGDLSGNLLDLDILINFKPDRIIHLAAQAGVRYSIDNPKTYISSNIIAFHNILEYSRKQNIEHLIYASSSSVYGMNDKVPFSVSDNTDHPMSLYAATKKSNEIIAHSYSHLFNIPCTGLRFFTVYGPWGRPDMALYKFTKSIIEKKPIQLYNKGNLSRDFTYVDDIINGIISASNNPALPDPKWTGSDPSKSSAPFRIYNLGRGQPVLLNRFIEALENKLNTKAICEYIEMQAGDVFTTHADITETFADLNYQPVTSIEEGISSFIDWYRSYYKSPK